MNISQSVACFLISSLIKPFEFTLPEFMCECFDGSLSSTPCVELMEACTHREVGESGRKSPRMDPDIFGSSSEVLHRHNYMVQKEFRFCLCSTCRDI